ncbi:MAG TPA: hypothetical protein VKE40_10595 [Gemmataceae bacterium]|nr:hypothetical protein [Gemmataceae bacterium]
MSLPLRFPDPLEEARRRAEEFQRLSSTDRWREMAAMMAFGLAMVRESPRRAEIERRMEEQEQEWRQIQERLFARHGR